MRQCSSVLVPCLAKRAWPICPTDISSGLGAFRPLETCSNAFQQCMMPVLSDAMHLHQAGNFQAMSVCSSSSACSSSLHGHEEQSEHCCSLFTSDCSSASWTTSSRALSKLRCEFLRACGNIMPNHVKGGRDWMAGWCADALSSTRPNFSANS